MPRPVPRRRSEREAPDADQYTSRRARAQAQDNDDDGDAEERRPRRSRGRGELPQRGGGRRAAARDDEPKDDGFPTSKRALAKLSDEDWDALVDELELDPDEATEDSVWEAIEERRTDGGGDDEPPARGRRSRRASRDDDEDDKPARGRSRRSSRSDDDEDEDRGSRRRGRGRSRDDDDDDDDEETTRFKPASGFQGFKKTREAVGGFDDDFKLTEDEVLVKFLEPEPFATYGEHGLYKELKDGQRVWTCLKPHDDCPICDTGHKPRPVALWNIVVIPEEGKPELKVLKAGPKLEKILEKKAALKTGPMDKEYYSLSQSEAKNDGPVEYSVEVVRERDLGEWDADPFTDDELDDWLEKAHDADFVKYPSRKQAREIARALLD